MSYVTNLILRVGTSDVEQGMVAEVNRYFEGRGGSAFVNIAETEFPARCYGGSKALEADILIGAFNFLDLHEFYGYLRNLKWVSPEDLQIMVCQQEDFAFRLINVFPTEFAAVQREFETERVDGKWPDYLSALQILDEQDAL